MAGYGLSRTNPRAPSFSLCCSPTVRRPLVLHDESNPTTSRLVRASEADEIIDDRIDILRLERCFVVHARVCHRRKLYISFVLAELGSCQLMPPSLDQSTRDTPSSPSNAMPRPECRSAGLKSMKQSSCAALVWRLSYLQSLRPLEADLAMQRHRRRRGTVTDEVSLRSSGPLLGTFRT
jgi:hypothetical protein